MLQLRLGSGSTALYRSTVYGNGVAPALNTFSHSMQFLLCCRSRSRIMMKFRLRQYWFLAAPAPQQGFYVHKKPQWGGNDVYGPVSKAESHPEQHCWIWSLILWWLLSPVFSWLRSPMFRWLQPYLEMAPAVALMFNIESWSQWAGAG
jgi:hypothetical protein